jgi:Flp pilus assembly protein TadG
LRERADAERGQVLVLAAVGMVAICAMAGFVIDVGVWFQAHRKQQAIADAAALAAAADLPNNTSQASTDASSYASKNGGSVNTISFSTTYLPSDTVTVTAQSTVPAYFLKVVGYSSTTVKATATVRADNLGAAYGAAPFGVINTQPQLAGTGCPCFGVSTTLDLSKVGPGSFGIINIDGSKGGNGPGTLATWIINGCACTTTTPVWLNSDPGAKFNSSQVKGAMDQEIGHTLLFPVYDQTSGNGANLQYHVIGFAGFTVTGYTFKGNSGTITGSFTKVDWHGTGTNSASNYFGATTSRIVG